MSRLRIRVTGVVQGVGFRYHVVRHARLLGLTGWVRNRADGSVEMEAAGAAGPLNAFAAEIKIGPPGAHVTGLTIDRFEDDLGYESFEIRS